MSDLTKWADIRVNVLEPLPECSGPNDEDGNPTMTDADLQLYDERTALGLRRVHLAITLAPTPPNMVNPDGFAGRMKSFLSPWMPDVGEALALVVRMAARELDEVTK